MTLHENQPTLIVNFQSYHALDFSVHRGKKRETFVKLVAWLYCSKKDSGGSLQKSPWYRASLKATGATAAGLLCRWSDSLDFEAWWWTYGKSLLLARWHTHTQAANCCSRCCKPQCITEQLLEARFRDSWLSQEVDQGGKGGRRRRREQQKQLLLLASTHHDHFDEV